MKKNKIKKGCLILSVFFTIFLITSCSNKESVNIDLSNNSTFDEITFPLEKTEKLTYWSGLHRTVAATSTSLGDIPLYKELEKRTGVKIEFIHPAQGQEDDQFNLMIASGEYPDIIERSWFRFPGGPEKAIKDNIIIPLNKYLESNTSNLKKVLSQNSEWDKMVKTDEGNYYVFPFIRGDEILSVYSGPMIRKDWLDDLNMDIPETIDEWYDVLIAFRDKKGADAPLTFQPIYVIGGYAFIAGSYGVRMDFFQEDGKMKYGPIEPEYKEFLKTFKKWYSEGLIDRDFATLDVPSLDAKITTGRSGATFGTAGQIMGKYLQAMAEKQPEFNLVGTPYPSLKKGEIPKIGQKDTPYAYGGSAAISTQCKNQDLAAKWLDYAYGEEGHMLFNFGIEGESYELVDDYPKYTDIIQNNPDGLSVANALGQYIRASYAGPMIQDKRYIEQYYGFQQQKDAIKAWELTEMEKHSIASITPLTEESQELSKIMNEVKTYVDEMFYKFVMGSEPIEKFDEYVNNIKAMGIDRAIQINQDALERYYIR